MKQSGSMYLILVAFIIFASCGSGSTSANEDDEESELTTDYGVELSIQDSLHSIDIEFGQKEEATDGFDSGIDMEAPPNPPKGALNAVLKNNGLDYYKDFRNNSDQENQWNLHYQIGHGDSLEINWDISSTDFKGMLNLTNNSGSFELNMREESSYIFNIDDHENLLIRFKIKD